MANKPTDPQDDERRVFAIDLLKHPEFRYHHVDGMWGTIDNEGMVCLAFFHTRETLPRRVEFELDEEGMIVGDGPKVERRADQVRDVQTGVVLSIETARNIRDWITEILRDAEGATGAN